MGVFEKYDQAVHEILEGKSTKETIALFGPAPAEDFDGRAAVKALMATIEDSWAGVDVREGARNWAWRKPSSHSPKTEEVAIERLVVQRGGADHWSYQMSTTSGIGAWSSRRCAIDLVRDYRNGHFAFIELKVRSDDPLHAAFEILRYYLAYVWARNRSHGSLKNHNVMTASRVDLVVLAPTEWYVYPSVRGKRAVLELGWFAEQIAAGMREVAPSELEVSFQFKSFRGTTPEEQAGDIVRLFRSSEMNPSVEA